MYFYGLLKWLYRRMLQAGKNKQTCFDQNLIFHYLLAVYQNSVTAMGFPMLNSTAELSLFNCNRLKRVCVRGTLLLNV